MASVAGVRPRMTTGGRIGSHLRGVLRLGWCLFLIGWTVSLLTTYPAEVAHHVLPPPVRFTLSKGLHVSAYALLAGLVPWLWRRPAWRGLLLAALSLHGFATEFMQQWVAQRTGSLRDVGIDHAGLLLGLALGWWTWRSHAVRRPTS